MSIEEYLKKHNLPVSQFADQIGVSYHTLRKYILGKLMPMAARARKIVEQSNGEITFEDLGYAQKITYIKKKHSAASKKHSQPPRDGDRNPHE